MMTKIENEEQYELAVARVEELLPLVNHYPIATPRLSIKKDFREAFAEAIDGVLLDAPIGVAEVVKGKTAWQLNAVKVADLCALESVPVMVGICSPDYSYGISDPHSEADKTGRAVLNIWSERVNIALDYYDEVRRLVRIYSECNGNCCLFEKAIATYRSKDYAWSVNSEGRLVGKHKTTGKISFTWNPIGAQFFIHETIPDNVV